MAARKGPYVKFPSGQYIGCKVEDVIRRDPRYFMWAVKEFLNITPEQAYVFEEVTEGSIPEAYIVYPKTHTNPPKKTESPQEDNPPLGWLSWGPEGIEEVYREGWVIPNHDFDPSMAPQWWPEFKKRCRGMSPEERSNLYEEYRRRDLLELKKMWEKS